MSSTPSDEFAASRELCQLNLPSSGWTLVQVDGRTMELPGGFARVASRPPVVGDLIVTKGFMPPNFLANTYGWVLSMDPDKKRATIVLISPHDVPIRDVPFDAFVIGERPPLAEREAGEYDVDEAIRRSLADF